MTTTTSIEGGAESLRVLVTGAAGFVGSHLADRLVEAGAYVTGIDSFRHAGDSARISASALGTNRYSVHACDLSVPVGTVAARLIGPADVIYNIASMSNVDESLSAPATTVMNNVGIIVSVLELAKELRPRLLVHMSTDEVYGPAESGVAFDENQIHRPSNPYAASKAAQEAVLHAYRRSFGIPAVVVNATNVVGERQSASKYIPKAISAALSGQPIEVHASDGVPGSRMYVHVSDVCEALEFVANLCLQPESKLTYAKEMLRLNLSGQGELDNLQVAEIICEEVGVPLRTKVVDGEVIRPGHDSRYALDSARLRSLGWSPKISPVDAVRRTVRWFIANPEWLA